MGAYFMVAFFPWTKTPRSMSILSVTSVAHFGRNLKRLREARDLSQEDFAWRAGIGRSEVTKYENGRRNPRLTTIVKMARGLDIDVCELLKGIR
jgi:DNA-binding XRE family transcriptional regulator